MAEGRLLKILTETLENSVQASLASYILVGPPDSRQVGAVNEEIVESNGDRFVLLGTTSPIDVFYSVGSPAISGKGAIVEKSRSKAVLVPSGHSLNVITAGGMADVLWQEYERPGD